MLRISPRRLRSMLRSAHAYDWQRDPFARGAYSYLRVGAGNARGALARPIEQTLFLAGEATDTTASRHRRRRPRQRPARGKAGSPGALT
jgi:hypothetical protein